MSKVHANPQAGQGIPLPKRENDLFKSVVKQYEAKQYKKGLKAADAILKRFPNHGETLCMKGLILHHHSASPKTNAEAKSSEDDLTKKRKDEAITLVKMGLMQDMRSHVCWHVYGLLYRSERNYAEAIKAYKQALRIDEGNLQILRDLSLLQVQMRDLNGFEKTRHTILELAPNQKLNWLTFALAKNMNDDLEGAISVIDIYLGTLRGATDAGNGYSMAPDLCRNFEASELVMYKNRLMAQRKSDNLSEKWEKALNHLEDNKGIVVDEMSWHKAKAFYLLQLRKYKEAEDVYLQLMHRGSTEDYSVHSGLMAARLQLDSGTCMKCLTLSGTTTLATRFKLESHQKVVLLQLYQGELLNQFPKSQAIKRIPLTLMDSSSNEWKDSISEHIKKSLIRGVPSLGSDLASLILIVDDSENNTYRPASDPIEVKHHPVYERLAKIVDSNIESLVNNQKFDINDDDELIQPPSTLLWAWYLRAELHRRAAEYTDALCSIEKCIEQTPTAVDAYELKGVLLSEAGNGELAVEAIEEGRALDLQDRYINNLVTRYWLKCNRDDMAWKRVALFTRHESAPEQYMFDMQTTWFELELAACHFRKKEFGKSLKQYMAVEKHFEDIHEDQFDFHSYCIRKVTLRTYADVLKWEDNLLGHEFYVTAAKGLIENFLFLFDNPPSSNDGLDKPPDYTTMTAAERKKAKAKARKKKKAMEKAAEAKRLEDEEKNKKEKNNGGNGSKAIKDKDPDGNELLQKDPLAEAKKYVGTLVKNAPNQFDTWILQYDVAIRRGKVVMALQALFKAKALDSQRSELFNRIVQFFGMDFSNASLPAVSEQVLTDGKKMLLDNFSLEEYVVNTLKLIQNDRTAPLGIRVAVAEALLSLKVGNVEDAVSLLMERGLDVRGVSVDACRDVLNCLRTLGDKRIKDVQAWIDMVNDYFPHVTDFK